MLDHLFVVGHALSVERYLWVHMYTRVNLFCILLTVFLMSCDKNWKKYVFRCWLTALLVFNQCVIDCQPSLSHPIVNETHDGQRGFRAVPTYNSLPH